MKKNLIKTLLCLVFFIPPFFHLVNSNQTQAATTGVKDQLSSGQLSYFAKLGVGNTPANSIIYIGVSAGTSGPSANNYNLDIGDTLYISVSSGGTAPYVVSGLSDTNAIMITTGLGVGSTTSGLNVIVPRYAVHTVSFTPSNNVAGGKWQVLIKTNGVGGSDGLPDTDGFDLGFLNTGAVTCPFGGGNATAIGTTTINSGIGVTGSYIYVTCPSGAGSTNPIGVGGSMVIGVGNSMLVNPAPATNHVTGQAVANADTYSVVIFHIDGSGIIIDDDTAQSRIALTESVRITATVDPTITFIISNVGVTNIGTSLCETAIGAGAINTTAGSVNFGSLNLSEFNNLAQSLSCTTNASNGYAIQTFESGRLTMIGGATTIPDTVCGASQCNTTTGQDWTDKDNYFGFGYSFEINSVSTGLGTTTIGVASGQYKPFGVNYGGAANLFSRTGTPSGNDSFYICYRIAISNYQPAGNYQNEVNYIATATF